MHIYGFAKTASRNVAFKVARMREAIMEDQDELIIRRSGGEEVGSEANSRAVLEDIGITQTCILPIRWATRKTRRA